MRSAVIDNGTQRRLYCYVFVVAVLASWMEVARLNMASRSIRKRVMNQGASEISQILDLSNSVTKR